MKPTKSSFNGRSNNSSTPQPQPAQLLRFFQRFSFFRSLLPEPEAEPEPERESDQYQEADEDSIDSTFVTSPSSPILPVISTPPDSHSPHPIESQRNILKTPEISIQQSNISVINEPLESKSKSQTVMPVLNPDPDGPTQNPAPSPEIIEKDQTSDVKNLYSVEKNPSQAQGLRKSKSKMSQLLRQSDPSSKSTSTSKMSKRSKRSKHSKKSRKSAKSMKTNNTEMEFEDEGLELNLSPEILQEIVNMEETIKTSRNNASTSVIQMASSTATSNNDNDSDFPSDSSSVNSWKRFEHLISSKNKENTEHKLSGKLEAICEYIRTLGSNAAVLEGPSLKLPKKTLVEYFNNRMMKNRILPDSNAIIFDRVETMSFQRLDMASHIVGKIIVEILEVSGRWTNYKPNQDLIIAISAPVSIQFIVLIFSILKIGATYLPIDPLLPSHIMINVLKTLQPILFLYLVTGKRTQETFNQINEANITTMVNIDDIWLQYENFKPAPGCDNPVDVKTNISLSIKHEALKLRPVQLRSVVVFYKFSHTGVVIPLKFGCSAIFNRLIWSWRTFPYVKEDILLLQSSIYDVSSVAEIFAPLLQGLTLVILSPADLDHPEMFMSKIRDHSITRITVTPLLIKALMTAMELDHLKISWAGKVRIWFCMYEPITMDMAEQFFQRYDRHMLFVTLFGTDENLGVCTYKVFTRMTRLTRNDYYFYCPVGVPLPNTIIYVVDNTKDFSVVPRNYNGEIFVSTLQSCFYDKNELQCLSDMNRTSEEYDNYLFFENHFMDESQVSQRKKIKKKKRKDFRCIQRIGAFGRVGRPGCFECQLLFDSWSAFEVITENIRFDIREVKYYIERSKLTKECHVMTYQLGQPSQKVVAFCVPISPETDKDELESALFSLLDKELPTTIIPDIMIVPDTLPRLLDNAKVNENALLKLYYTERTRRKNFDDMSKYTDRLENPKKRKAAIVLFTALTNLLGVSVEVLCKNLEKSFFQFGGTNFNSVFVVKELHKHLYQVSIEEFIGCPTLWSIINLMSKIRVLRGLTEMDEVSQMQMEGTGTDLGMYYTEPVTDYDKKQVISILSAVLTEKGTIEFLAGVNKREMTGYLNETWPIYTYKFYSYLAVRKRGDRGSRVGCIINVNCSLHNQQLMKFKPSNRTLWYKHELVEYLTSGPQGNANILCGVPKTHLLQILYVGAQGAGLDSIEKDKIILLLIQESIKAAKASNYSGIIFTCFDAYLTGICVRDFNFKTFLQCQVNKFIATDGHVPFRLVPDCYIATLCIKKF